MSFHKERHGVVGLGFGCIFQGKSLFYLQLFLDFVKNITC